jgi:hypothetical protein
MNLSYVETSTGGYALVFAAKRSDAVRAITRVEKKGNGG